MFGRYFNHFLMTMVLSNLYRDLRHAVTCNNTETGQMIECNNNSAINLYSVKHEMTQLQLNFSYLSNEAYNGFLSL